MITNSHLPSRSHAPLVLAGGLTAVGLVTGMVVEDAPVLCLFRRCTGGYCPGCGGSRAARSLFTGNFGEAWGQHPWTVLIALQLVAMGFVVTVLSPRSIRPSLRPVIVFNIVIGVAIWVVRLAEGSIPVPFS